MFASCATCSSDPQSLPIAGRSRASIFPLILDAPRRRRAQDWPECASPWARRWMPSNANSSSRRWRPPAKTRRAPRNCWASASRLSTTNSRNMRRGGKMRLSLKTKFTLATSLLVLAVVTGVSGLYIARLTRQVLRQADDRASFVALQVYDACNQALKDASQRDEAPTSPSPQDLRTYAQKAFDNSATLNTLIESAVAYSPTIYEITISDKDGIVLVSSDASLRGQKVAKRPSVSSLVSGRFFEQLRTLYGPPQTYEYSYPFLLGAEHFGDIRIGLSSVFIRNEISPGLQSAGWYALGSVLLSTFLAFAVSTVSLAPIDRISTQLDRISAGEFDMQPAVERGDELGAVSTK